MYDPVTYQIQRAYPRATPAANLPFTHHTATLHCAQGQQYWVDEGFQLAYCYHDAKDVFIATLEIHAHEPLYFPIACSHFDLHGCYVEQGQVTLYQPGRYSTAPLILHTEEYALIYAPRGNYNVEVPQGTTIVHLWSTNRRLLLRQRKHNALAPLHTLLGQWTDQAPNCHHTRLLPLSNPVHTTWWRLLKLPTLKPLLMDARLHELIAELVYACIDALRESRNDGNKSLRLLHELRQYAIQQVKQVNIPKVEELAARWGISESYLVRIHKHHYGTTLKTWITKLRMHRARELLASSQYSITQVAYLVGYGSLADFRKRYRAYFGEWPGR